MPEWLTPLLVAGGTGLGAVLNALFSAKSQAYTQLNALVDQLQEDRETDRAEVRASRDEMKSLGEKVDSALFHLQIEREYSTDLYTWGMNGAPPPPPQRRLVTPIQ